MEVVAKEDSFSVWAISDYLLLYEDNLGQRKEGRYAGRNFKIPPSIPKMNPSVYRLIISITSNEFPLRISQKLNFSLKSFGSSISMSIL